jgi:hypothetical protein
MEDLLRKVQTMEGAFDYRIMMTLPVKTRNPPKAIVRCAEDGNMPYLWQVMTQNSTVNFRTMREATDYCRKLGLL